MTGTSATTRFLIVYVGLLLLTGLTVAVAYADLGALGIPVALLIASIKTILVACVFMRLLHADRTAIMFLMVGGFLFFLLVLISYFDALIVDAH